MERSMKYWITGASSGIGQALAEQLAGQGHEVAVSARSEASLQALAARYPGQVQVFPTDTTDRQALAHAGTQIRARFEHLDVVVLNAGTCEYVDAADWDSELFERVMRTNFQGTVNCIEQALPLLRAGRRIRGARHRPVLAAVASSAAYLALTRAEAYGASKAAVQYLMEGLRVDLWAEGIDVCVINPGFVDTPLTAVNDFPMPAMLSTEQAATLIRRGLERHRAVIDFPKRLTWPLRALRHLPPKWRARLLQPTVRKPDEGASPP